MTLGRTGIMLNDKGIVLCLKLSSPCIIFLNIFSYFIKVIYYSINIYLKKLKAKIISTHIFEITNIYLYLQSK